MNGLYHSIINFVVNTFQEYQNQTFIDQHDRLIIYKLWPTFSTMIMLYTLYSFIFVIFENVSNFEFYNSHISSMIHYVLLGIVHPLIIVYSRWISQKIEFKKQVKIATILLLFEELTVQAYSFEMLNEKNQDESLVLVVMYLALISILICTKNLLIRLLLILRFFGYFAIRNNYFLFQSIISINILVFMLLLVYFWDQQIIRFSNVSNFAEQTLKSIPSAVCILSSDCKEALFLNRFMRKIMLKAQLSKSQTKSIRVQERAQFSQESEHIGIEITDFLKYLFVNYEEAKQQLLLDQSKFNLEDEDEDHYISLYSILQQIIKSDKKSQGQIYFFRCEYINESDQTINDSQKVIIEARIKTQLYFASMSETILLNLYDVSTNFKSIYYKNMNHFKSRVIRSISHELRTRLNAIQGVIMMIQDKDQGFGSEIRTLLRAAYNNCRIQNFIISSIINYNLLRESKIATKVDKCKLTLLIQEVVDLFREEAELKSIKIKFEHTIDSQQFEMIDQEKFQSILIHIISNSLKFNRKNGFINVKLSRDTSKEQVIQRKRKFSGSSLLLHRSEIVNLNDSSVYPKPITREKGQSRYQVHSQYSSYQNYSTGINDQYLIEIKDNGFGISEDKLANIKEMLICEDSSYEKYSNDSAEGMMLGLRASNQLVKFLGGKEENSYLLIDSTEGIGTCVQVHLKVRIFTSENVSSDLMGKESQIEVEVPIRTFNNFLQKSWFANPIQSIKPICICEQTILIVDDEPYNLLVLESLLKQLQQHVITADNGRQSVQIMETYVQAQLEHKCKGLKAIIMDYQMPIMNGEMAAQLIIGNYHDHGIQSVPIFGLTGFSGEEEISKLLQAGMKEVFIKPITLRTLEDLISAIARGDYKSNEYISNLSQQQFQCIEMDYDEERSAGI